MGLNPSNLIAARDNPGATMFPNLARFVPEDETEKRNILADVDAACLSELEEAGIQASSAEWLRFIHGPGEDYREVPTKHVGDLCLWSFRRAWYYWVAEGPGLPPEVAADLHRAVGKACRVNGSCMCPSPAESNHGFAIGLYHVDTQEALNALALTLRRVYR